MHKTIKDQQTSKAPYLFVIASHLACVLASIFFLLPRICHPLLNIFVHLLSISSRLHNPVKGLSDQPSNKSNNYNRNSDIADHLILRNVIFILGREEIFGEVEVIVSNIVACLKDQESNDIVISVPLSKSCQLLNCIERVSPFPDPTNTASCYDKDDEESAAANLVSLDDGPLDKAYEPRYHCHRDRNDQPK